MQRFKQPNMDLHPDGEWIRYSDHVEAMKRVTLSAGEAQKMICPNCGTGDVELLRLCHNSACVAYACEESIYKGWETAVATPSASARAEQVEDARDAVRYRWLRDNAASVDWSTQREIGGCTVIARYCRIKRDEMDCTIDAAMIAMSSAEEEKK